MSSTRDELRRWWRRTARYRPSSWTGWIVAVTVAVYVVELVFPVAVQNLLGYNPCYSVPTSSRCVAQFGTGIPFEPWRMLTVLLVHSPASLPYDVLPLTHILFNMYALYLFGRPLENVLGGGRLLALYLISGFAGSVAVLWAATSGILSLSTYVIGASGAVFGVMGATAAVHRRLGGDIQWLIAMIGINLVLGFVVPGIAWEAHIGGLLVGALVGWLFVANRGPRRLWIGPGWAGGIVAALVVLTAIPALM